jgi:gliding motility-associated-like protein
VRYPIPKIYLFLFLVIIGNEAFGQLELNVTINEPSCTRKLPNVSAGNFNTSDGSIIVTASGGTAPYSFTLSGGNANSISQNNGYFPQLTEAGYTLQVTDVNGLVADTSITLLFTLPQPIINVSYLNLPSSCNSFDGSFAVMGSAGTPPYTYSIDGGLNFSTQDTFTNLSQGQYYPLIQDANGCFSYRAATTFYSSSCVGAGEAIDIFSSSACSNDGKVLVVPALVLKPPVLFSYDSVNFYPANIIVNYPNNLFLDEDTASNFSPGLHHVYIKDSTNNIVIAGFEVNKDCSISITFVGIDASCHQNDGAIAITAVNGTSPYTYTMDGVNYQTDSVFSGLASGNYSVTVKDAGGETSSATATVYNKCPILSVTKTDETCGRNNAGIITGGIKGTHPYQFSINDGLSYQTDSVYTGLDSGNYEIILKDANGFMDSTNITVNNNCLLISATGSNETCGNKNDTIMVKGLGGTPPYSYSIDGINFQYNNIFTGLDSGAYTVSIEDASGLDTTTSIYIGNIPAPTINLGNDTTLCDGQTLGMSANIPGINVLYTWQDGTVSNNYLVSQAGKYWVDATNNGCTSTDTIQVNYNPTPIVFLGNDTAVCAGDTMLLDAPASAQDNYLWQDNRTADSYAVTTPGTYAVKVTNQFNCSAADSIAISFKPLPVFSLGNDTALCIGQSLTLQPILPPGSYLWNTGNASSSLTIHSAGWYWLQVTQNGCSKTDSINVSAKFNAVINLGNDTTLCTGQLLPLNVANNNATYLWQDASTQPTYTVNSPGTYSVKVALNGCDTSGQVIVQYTTKPIINLGNDTTICTSDQLILDASFPQATYLWQDGSVQSTYTVTQPGTYSVEATNVCGNTIDSVTIQYKNCTYKIYIPTAFSPNGDRIHDTWYIEYLEQYPNAEVDVFDRYGQVVYQSQGNYLECPWDGTCNGKPLPVGAYYYIINLNSGTQTDTEPLTGNVSIVR